jgi:hypothetical protein
MTTSVVRWSKRVAIGVAALLVLAFGVGTLASRNAANKATLSPVVRHITEGGAVGGGTAGSSGSAVVGFASRTQAGQYDAAPPATVNAEQSGVLPGLPDRVIRTADLSLRVGKSKLDAAWAGVVRLASRFGGFVLSSSRGNGGRPIPVEGDAANARSPESGDLTIRVPAAKFEDAMAELRKIGTVLGDNVTSQDVTQEFVDLESRLRNQRAQQSVLIRLMSQARNVGETLAVQQQLSQVQEQIEQMTGRLNMLKTLTALSTISVHLFEPGAVGAPVPPQEGPSFAKAWDTAVEGLLRIATVAMIAALWLAPFAVLAVVALAFRRSRLGPPAETTTP